MGESVATSSNVPPQTPPHGHTQHILAASELGSLASPQLGGSSPGSMRAPGDASTLLSSICQACKTGGGKIPMGILDEFGNRHWEEGLEKLPSSQRVVTVKFNGPPLIPSNFIPKPKFGSPIESSSDESVVLGGGGGHVANIFGGGNAVASGAGIFGGSAVVASGGSNIFGGGAVASGGNIFGGAGNAVGGGSSIFSNVPAGVGAVAPGGNIFGGGNNANGGSNKQVGSGGASSAGNPDAVRKLALDAAKKRSEAKEKEDAAKKQEFWHYNIKAVYMMGSSVEDSPLFDRWIEDNFRKGGSWCGRTPRFVFERLCTKYKMRPFNPMGEPINYAAGMGQREFERKAAGGGGTTGTGGGAASGSVAGTGAAGGSNAAGAVIDLPDSEDDEPGVPVLPPEILAALSEEEQVVFIMMTAKDQRKFIEEHPKNPHPKKSGPTTGISNAIIHGNLRTIETQTDQVPVPDVPSPLPPIIVNSRPVPRNHFVLPAKEKLPVVTFAHPSFQKVFDMSTPALADFLATQEDDLQDHLKKTVGSFGVYSQTIYHDVAFPAENGDDDIQENRIDHKNDENVCGGKKRGRSCVSFHPEMLRPRGRAAVTSPDGKKRKIDSVMEGSDKAKDQDLLHAKAEDHAPAGSADAGVSASPGVNDATWFPEAPPPSWTDYKPHKSLADSVCQTVPSSHVAVSWLESVIDVDKHLTSDLKVRFLLSLSQPHIMSQNAAARGYFQMTWAFLSSSSSVVRFPVPPATA